MEAEDADGCSEEEDEDAIVRVGQLNVHNKALHRTGNDFGGRRDSNCNYSGRNQNDAVPKRVLMRRVHSDGTHTNETPPPSSPHSSPPLSKWYYLHKFVLRMQSSSSPTRKRGRDNAAESTPIASSPPVRDDDGDMAEVADAFEDDIDEVRDLEDIDDEVDGEDLFGENMMRYTLFVSMLTSEVTINHARRRTFMTLRILMTRMNMTIWILRLVDVLRHNLIVEIESLLNVELSNDHPPFSTLVCRCLCRGLTSRR